MNKTTEAFEAWWADTGEQSLFALGTTTDEDIKTLAGIAWEAAIREALAEPVKQEPVARVPAHPEQGLEWLQPPPVWGTLLYAEQVQPVKQETSAWHHQECEGECIACLIERCVKGSYGKQGVDYMLRHINAAPVDTKAIRAEALKEAAKVCEEDESGRDGGGYYAELIRGLK